MMPLKSRYLELLKKALLNELYVELEAQLVYAVLCASHDEVPELDKFTGMRGDRDMLAHLKALKQEGDTLLLKGLDEMGESRPDPSLRNHSEFAHTMLGRRRLDHLQHCLETVIREKIPGDVLEAGGWRGGGAVLMRGVLEAWDDRDRRVWVADSFQGLPKSRAAADQGFEMDAEILPVLSVSEDDVRELFDRYNLLDDRVCFLPGWFGETLPAAPITECALLHVDADLYRSTRDVLDACYDKVAPGGFVIIDDYGMLPPCREAVDEFLAARRLDPEMEVVGEHAVAWRVEQKGRNS